jgi:purine-binding chemotaxis protein CheW
MTALQKNAASNLMQLVTFSVERDEYALDILKVQEIIRLRKLTQVPNSPSFIEGVVNLRGKVIPVMNFRKRFQLKDIPYGRGTRIIVLEENDIVAGLLVDSVAEVLRVPESLLIESPASTKSKIDVKYKSGIIMIDNRLITILNISTLMDLNDLPEAHKLEATHMLSEPVYTRLSGTH